MYGPASPGILLGRTYIIPPRRRYFNAQVRKLISVCIKTNRERSPESPHQTCKKRGAASPPWGAAPPSPRLSAWAPRGLRPPGPDGAGPGPAPHKGGHPSRLPRLRRGFRGVLGLGPPAARWAAAGLRPGGPASPPGSAPGLAPLAPPGPLGPGSGPLRSLGVAPGGAAAYRRAACAPCGGRGAPPGPGAAAPGGPGPRRPWPAVGSVPSSAGLAPRLLSLAAPLAGALRSCRRRAAPPASSCRVPPRPAPAGRPGFRPGPPPLRPSGGRLGAACGRPLPRRRPPPWGLSARQAGCQGLRKRPTGPPLTALGGPIFVVDTGAAGVWGRADHFCEITKMVLAFIEQVCYDSPCKGAPHHRLQCSPHGHGGGGSFFALLAPLVAHEGFFTSTPSPSRPPPHEGPGEAQGSGMLCIPSWHSNKCIIFVESYHHLGTPIEQKGVDATSHLPHSPVALYAIFHTLPSTAGRPWRKSWW